MANRHVTFLVSFISFVSLAGCTVGSPAEGAGARPAASAVTPSPAATSARPPREYVDDPVRLAQWAGKYCTAIGPLNAQAAEFEASILASTVEDLVPTLVAGVGDLHRAYAEGALAMARAGVPPIEGGAEIFDINASIMFHTHELYADMEHQLAALPADDVDAIMAVLTEAEPQLRAGRKALKEALQRPELNTAFDTAPECRDVPTDES